MKLNGTLFNIPIINNVLYYDTITSTNDKAKELGRRGSVHGSLIVAKTQTAGRGRLGRSFDSDTDDGLYFSLMLRPEVMPNHLPSITLMTALAVSKAIEDSCQLHPSIKWPNDIYYNNKKISGILTEAGPDYVVVGIGVNVNTKHFHEDIAYTASSLSLETGVTYIKEDLLSNILWSFNNLYQEFLSNSDIGFMVNEYNNRLVSLNREVYIIPQHYTLNNNNPGMIDTTGLTPVLCLGIDNNGNLAYKDHCGNIDYVNSGEVSLRNATSSD